jgi:hypothetical protein
VLAARPGFVVATSSSIGAQIRSYYPRSNKITRHASYRAIRKEARQSSSPRREDGSVIPASENLRNFGFS